MKIKNKYYKILFDLVSLEKHKYGIITHYELYGSKNNTIKEDFLQDIIKDSLKEFREILQIKINKMLDANAIPDYNSLKFDLIEAAWLLIDNQSKEYFQHVEQFSKASKWTKAYESKFIFEIKMIIENEQSEIGHRIESLVKEKEILDGDISKIQSGSDNIQQEVANLQEINNELTEKYKIANVELHQRNEMIKKLRKKVRFPQVSKEELMNVIDENRKKNGKHHYTNIAAVFGVNRTTVKNWIIKFGLEDY